MLMAYFDVTNLLLFQLVLEAFSLLPHNIVELI
jgi:hypothetical protein